MKAITGLSSALLISIGIYIGLQEPDALELLTSTLTIVLGAILLAVFMNMCAKPTNGQ